MAAQSEAGGVNASAAIRVGLLGIGTVGGGTFSVLARNREEIRRRAGRDIQITVVADRDTQRAAQVIKAAGLHAAITADAFSVVNDPAIDVVVELIGGYTIARELVLQHAQRARAPIRRHPFLAPRGSRPPQYQRDRHHERERRRKDAAHSGGR